MLCTDLVLNDPGTATVTDTKAKAGQGFGPFDVVLLPSFAPDLRNVALREFHRLPRFREDLGKIWSVFPSLPKSIVGPFRLLDLRVKLIYNGFVGVCVPESTGI